MLTVANGLTSVPSPLKSIPSTIAFGCAMPPTMFHPCAANRYEWCSICALQLCGALSARATPDMPSAIAATKMTDAHANSKELVMRLTSFIFISVSFFCFSFLVLAFFDFSSGGVISGCSPEYRTEISARLLGIRETFSNQGKQRQERRYLVTTSESRLCSLCCLLGRLFGDMPLRLRSRQDIARMTVVAAVSGALEKLQAARLPPPNYFGANKCDDFRSARRLGANTVTT